MPHLLELRQCVGDVVERGLGGFLGHEVFLDGKTTRRCYLSHPEADVMKPPTTLLCDKRNPEPHSTDPDLPSPLRAFDPDPVFRFSTR
jgi:hypothetical protein